MKRLVAFSDRFRVESKYFYSTTLRYLNIQSGKVEIKIS